jgi:hypothetical protein
MSKAARAQSKFSEAGGGLYFSMWGDRHIHGWKERMNGALFRDKLQGIIKGGNQDTEK